MSVSRRAFLAGGASLAFAGCARHVLGVDHLDYRNEVAGYGPLVDDPHGLFDLPRGFSYRVISRAGERMADGLVVPGKMDGMGCFDLGGGRVALVRNHEMRRPDTAESAFAGGGPVPDKAFDSVDGVPLAGGTTTIVYDTRSGRTERQHLSLAGTLWNCAGGVTPWGSWLSCEESIERAGRPHGWVFEVPAAGTGLADPVPLEGLGRFRHEAAAVDPVSGIVYLTEDRPDSLFYRFLPDRPGRLAAGGRLQALALADGTTDTRNGADAPLFAPSAWKDARWIDLDGTDSPEDDLRQRGHAQGAALFARGEGIHYGAGPEGGELYFTCTSGGRAGLGQIMRYRPGTGAGSGRLQLFLESRDRRVIDFADNLTVSPHGHLIVCEDKSSARLQADALNTNFLKGVTPEGLCYTLGRNAHAERAELAGVCFSPDGGTLFVNIYTPGITLAITGPWRRFSGRRLAA